MRLSLLTLGLVAALAAPDLAHASCHGRKVAGTLIGTAGGAIIGGAISHGRAGPTLLGAGLGALAGHTIAGSDCHDTYRRAYYSRRHRYYGGEYRRDYYGRTSYDGAAYASPGAGRCETRDEAFYDERGAVVYHPVQVCG